jgi:hypothetical protein
VLAAVGLCGHGLRSSLCGGVSLSWTADAVDGPMGPMPTGARDEHVTTHCCRRIGEPRHA